MGTSAARRAIRAKNFFVLFVTVLAIPSVAQQPAAPPQPALPVYDVVSIHPHSALDNNSSFSYRPDIFSATNITLKQLVAYAYGIREDLISDLPSWADSAHFDLTAKVSDPDPTALSNLTREQIEAMLRPVLADQFQLKLHTQINTLAVYDLVVTKDGPKFQKSPPPPVDPDHSASKEQHRNGSWQMNDGVLTLTSLPLSTLTGALAGELHRTVIDKTGLAGDYDLKLKWTPDDDARDASDNGAANPSPDLFTALQEQLGLKLVPSKGPVTTLVVDHAEKPSAN